MGGACAIEKITYEVTVSIQGRWQAGTTESLT